MKKTYRTQVQMINYRQVDVEIDTTIAQSRDDLFERVKAQAKKEFGDCDKVEIEYTEIV